MQLREALGGIFVVGALLLSVQFIAVQLPASAPPPPPPALLVHVVNLFQGGAVTAGAAAGADHAAELYDEYALAQQSWVRALEYARERGVHVDLVAACFAADAAALVRPPLRPIPHALRHSFNNSGRLPLLREILGGALEASTAQWLVYTNSDIFVRRDFYIRLAALVGGLRGSPHSFSVTRRDVPPVRATAELEEVEAADGVPHKGHDTFVLPRAHAAVLSRVGLGHLSIGYSPVGCFLLQALSLLGPLSVLRDTGWTLHTTATDAQAGAGASEAGDGGADYGALREARKQAQMARNRNATILNWLQGIDGLAQAHPEALGRCCASRERRGMYACCVAHCAVGDASIRAAMLGERCEALAGAPRGAPAAGESAPAASGDGRAEGAEGARAPSAAAMAAAARGGAAVADGPTVLVVLEQELDARLEAHAYSLRLLDYFGRVLGARLLVAHVRPLLFAGRRRGGGGERGEAGATPLGGPSPEVAWATLPTDVLRHASLGGADPAERRARHFRLSEHDLSPLSAAWLARQRVSAVVAVLSGPQPGPKPSVAMRGDGTMVSAPSFGQLLHRLIGIVSEYRAMAAAASAPGSRAPAPAQPGGADAADELSLGQRAERVPLALVTAGLVGPDDAADVADAAALETDEAASDALWALSESSEQQWRARLATACAEGVSVVLAASEAERAELLRRRPCAHAADAASARSAARGTARVPLVDSFLFSQPHGVLGALQKAAPLEFEARLHVIFVGTPGGRASVSVRWLLHQVWPLVGLLDARISLTLIGGYGTDETGAVRFGSWAAELAKATHSAKQLGRSDEELSALRRVFALSAPPSDLPSVLRMHRVLVDPAYPGSNGTTLSLAATLALANGAAVVSTTSRGIGCSPEGSVRRCEAVAVAPAADAAAMAALLARLHNDKAAWSAQVEYAQRHAALHLSEQALMDGNALERFVDLGLRAR